MIFRALKAGMSLQTAADLAGITRDTLRHWRDADDEFSSRVDKKRAESMTRLAQVIRGMAFRKGHPKQFEAATWVLSRRCPEFQDRQEKRDPVDAATLANALALMRGAMAASVPSIAADGSDGGRNGNTA